MDLVELARIYNILNKHISAITNINNQEKRVSTNKDTCKYSLENDCLKAILEGEEMAFIKAKAILKGEKMAFIKAKVKVLRNLYWGGLLSVYKDEHELSLDTERKIITLSNE
ncbi:3962_t:CDS:2, partial [Entrophospora sp. SA101]